MVLQEDFLFNGSIYENITLGNPEITPEQVVEAAHCGAHDFIGECPKGYDTNVGEREQLYLAVKRQRIASSSISLRGSGFDFG